MICYDLVIVGAGAAGLFGAAKAAERGLTVALLEKGERCGKKIAITGKGRCNLTNTREWSEFAEHIYPNPNFFKNAFYAMSNSATMHYFNQIGLPLTVERGQRVFPKSMRAQDVADVLLKRLKELKVNIVTNYNVTSVTKEDATSLFKIESEKGHKESIYSKNLLLATGGLSYPATGSTGDGYRFAEAFGHKIVAPYPSLTALIPQNYDQSLATIDLKNVELTLYAGKDAIQSEFGEMSFTTDGIEGAAAIKLSRKAVARVINREKIEIAIDLKPALSIAQLEARIEREMARNKNLHQLLKSLMPNALIAPFTKANKDLTQKNLPQKLKEWRFKIESFVGYRRSVVTAGGVDLQQVSPKSMESKLVKGLYFAGELLNLDGDTGGYNLQIAFSTAALAANSIKL